MFRLGKVKDADADDEEAPAQCARNIVSPRDAPGVPAMNLTQQELDEVRAHQEQSNANWQEVCDEATLINMALRDQGILTESATNFVKVYTAALPLGVVPAYINPYMAPGAVGVV